MYTKLSIVGLLATIAIIPSFVLAQAIPPAVAIPNGGVTVATVNIQDITAIQKGNDFTVNFKVSNREGAQPTVIYAIELYQKQQDGKLTLADKKVYTNDVLALGENQTIPRKVAYVAPSYLSGSFILKVTAKNFDGFPFGTVSLSYPVSLTSTTGSILINPSDCYLTIDKEKAGTKYEISKGVDILPSETLIAHCAITSTFAGNQSITPVFTLQYRSAFGNIIKTEKQIPITIAHGAHIAFTAPAVKADVPQAYDANLFFIDKTGAVVSPTVPFHFVLRGESATFQNITLDKTAYAIGDTAILTVFWSGSADQFPGARIQDNTKIVNPTIALSVKDGNASCSSEVTKTITEGQASIEKISVPITANCAKPIVVTRLTNQAGTVLAHQTYDVTPTSSAPKSTANTNILISYVVAVVLILLVVIGMIYMIIKKNKKKEAMIAVFLGFMVISGIFGFSKPASADTVTIITPYNSDGSKYITTIFSVNIDKSSYAKSCDLRAGVEVLCSVCNNAGTCDASTGRGDTQYLNDNSLKYDVSATVNGQTKTLLKNGNTQDQCVGATWYARGGGGQCAFSWYDPVTYTDVAVGNTVVFSTERVTGSYFSTFNLSVANVLDPIITKTAVANIPYTVNDNECVQAGECGDAIGNYPMEATTFSGPFCDPGTPTPSVPLFPKPGVSTTWMCGSSSCTATRNGEATGVCGDAIGNYPAGATTFSGPFCDPGIASPLNPVFPSPGNSVSWMCNGNITCTASVALE